MLFGEMPELGKTEKDDDVIMVDAEDGLEETEGLSPDPDYGTSPEPRIDSDETSGDKDVKMETEPAAFTPRKRKLAECADGILSTMIVPYARRTTRSSWTVRTRRKRQWFHC